MTELKRQSAYPELKQLVAEASRALATLDADRLEELALCCQAFNRELMPTETADAPAVALARRRVARQARDAAADMAVFARVLDATRANLKVLRRLRDLRAGRFEYSDPEWTAAGSRHGHD
jgi:ABC-type transporter Mla subunit MlaD